MTKTRRWFGLIVVGATHVFTLGCTGDEEPVRASSPDDVVHQISDSAGVEIVVTSGAVMESPIGWRIDPEPMLTLGSPDGDDWIAALVGLSGVSGGGIAIVDSGHYQVWFFDDDGNRVATVGREGSGPGEFMSLTPVPSSSRDIVYVLDPANRRLTKIAADGVILEELSRASGLGGRGDGIVGDWILANRRVVLARPDLGLQRSENPWVWENLVTGENREITVVPIAIHWVSRRPNGMLYMGVLPFKVTPVAAAYQDAAVVTRGEVFEIETYDLAGELRRIARIEAARARVTSTELARYFEQRRGGQPDDFASAPIPDSFPGFSSLIADAEGWLWAQVFTNDVHAPTRWLIFGPDGHALGIVDGPPGLHIRDISEDYVLGSVMDSLGVSYVHRHGLVR